MAVNTEAIVQLFTFDRQIQESGEPAGYWEGYVRGDGAAGGGNNVLKITQTNKLANGRLFVIRNVTVTGPEEGTDLFSVYLSPSALRTNSMFFLSGTTDAGEAGGEGARVLQGLNYLWTSASNISATGDFIVLTTPNVDTEDWTLNAQGEFWELAKLRQQGRPPRIRY